ncbi:MAG: hypothetical protein LBK47_05145 [Prevotellaceae bacterium]|nr:hypothetical protein [Prevotellaceae bacterium]
MAYQLTYNDLLSLLHTSAELALQAYRIEQGEEPTTLSERQAAKKYGWSAVRRWKKEGELPVHKKGDKNHKLNFEARKLEEIAAAEKISAFLCYQKAVNK